MAEDEGVDILTLEREVPRTPDNNNAGSRLSTLKIFLNLPWYQFLQKFENKKYKEIKRK